MSRDPRPPRVRPDPPPPRVVAASLLALGLEGNHPVLRYLSDSPRTREVSRELRELGALAEVERLRREVGHSARDADRLAAMRFDVAERSVRGWRLRGKQGPAIARKD